MLFRSQQHSDGRADPAGHPEACKTNAGYKDHTGQQVHGLRDTSGKKKTIYNVFRYMDSSSSLKYTGKVLNRQVGNWQSMVPGYTAKRVYNMYRN